MSQHYINKPSPAFIMISWIALILGAFTYCIGLFNAQILLNEKGYYLVLLMYGLFSAVSLQKVIRDRLEGIAVTPLYYALCWISVGSCIVLLLISLFLAQLSLSEKGFYLMAYLMSLFGAVTIQKNVRDLEFLRKAAPVALEHAILHPQKNSIEAPQNHATEEHK